MIMLLLILTASRISTKNERKMRLFLKNAYYSVDFIDNELKKLKKNKNNTFKTTCYKYEKTDSLNEEIKNFINTCYGKGKIYDNRQVWDKSTCCSKKNNK